MKKEVYNRVRVLLVGIICLLHIGVEAQTKSDLFTENSFDYYWLGIDYSHVKVVGDIDPNAVKDKYFTAWNYLIFNERTKYSVENMLRKEYVNYEIDYMDSLNSLIPVDGLKVRNYSKSLPDNIIESTIANYQLEQKNGIGIVLLAEYINKNLIKASHVIVIFNIENRDVLVKESIQTKPVGFGFRNYWAGAIYKLFEYVENRAYYDWEE